MPELSSLLQNQQLILGVFYGLFFLILLQAIYFIYVRHASFGAFFKVGAGTFLVFLIAFSSFLLLNRNLGLFQYAASEEPEVTPTRTILSTPSPSPTLPPSEEVPPTLPESSPSSELISPRPTSTIAALPRTGGAVSPTLTPVDVGVIQPKQPKAGAIEMTVLTLLIGISAVGLGMIF